MAVSNWWLYIGMFLCCTGFGLIPGAIFIVYWAIMRLENVKLGDSYTENNYDIAVAAVQSVVMATHNHQSQKQKTTSRPFLTKLDQ